MSNNPITIHANLKTTPISTDTLTYADNPQPRCPVVLLLDCSGSMEGEPIHELNRALRQFHDELVEDPVASQSVEVCIISFGDSVKTQRRFGPLGQPGAIPELTASGRTPLGTALRTALAEIRERRNFYRQHGLPAYQPWIVIMTDGQPNDEWREAAAEALAMSKAGRLVLLGVGVGPHVDMNTLRDIVGSDPGPFRLDGLRFRNFFRWLSDSLRAVAAGPAGNQPVITTADDDWHV